MVDDTTITDSTVDDSTVADATVDDITVAELAEVNLEQIEEISGLGKRHAIYLLGLGLAALGCTDSPSGRDAEPLTFRLASSSMAPRWMGPHLQATCSKCQNRFAIAAETFRPNKPTRCLRCEGDCVVDERLRAGDVVSVEPLGTRTEPLRRFTAVALSSPADSGPPLMKRIWGLPGERIAFEQGELIVNGQWFRKNLDELRSVAIPVIEITPEELAASPRPTDSPRLSVPQPTDAYACNQGTTRGLLPVSDYLVELEFATQNAMPLLIELQYQGRGVQIIVGGNNVNTLAQSDVQSFWVECKRQLSVAVCDGRLLVESDSGNAITWQVTKQDRPPGIRPAEQSPMPSPKFSIRPLAAPPRTTLEKPHSGSTGIQRLRLSRDILLRLSDRVGDESSLGLPLVTSGTETREALGESEYFVLGDNLPISVDSRNGLGVVEKEKIIGVVDL